MVVASTCFLVKVIHKGSWTTLDGNTANTIDHLLIDARHYSGVKDVRSRRDANINLDHFLVETRIRARLSNGKKTLGSKS